MINALKIRIDELEEEVDDLQEQLRLTQEEIDDLKLFISFMREVRYDD